MRKIGRFAGESALALACALLPAACGGQSTESPGATPESVCQLPGARDAKLPIELTAFGSEAMGAGPRGVYLAESLGEGRLIQVSRLGGTARTLATNLFYVEIRSSGDDIYVIAQGFAGGGSALYRVTPDQRLALLDADLHGANDLVITPTSLYLADSYDQVIYRYDRNGGGRRQVADHVGTAHLAVAGETLYYLATPDAGEGLYRLDPELGAVYRGHGVWASARRHFRARRGAAVPNHSDGRGLTEPPARGHARRCLRRDL